MVDEIAVFRVVYPLASETFISEQASFLRLLNVRFIVRDKVGDISWPHSLIGKGWRRVFWTLTRSVFFVNLSDFRNVRVIHAHFGHDGLMIYPLARRLGVPLVVTFHGMDITRHFDFSSSLKRPTEMWFHILKSQLMRQGRAFIAVSKFIERKLLESGFPPERIHQIYIGVDTDKFRPSSLEKKERYVLCVGRHTEKKGVDTLIRAWALIEKSFPDVKLIQVGSGGLTNSLEELARDLGVAHRITFLGSKPHEEVTVLMQGAEVFALPSQTASSGDAEALGIVFNEASACAVPVVSTWHGGIPEAVKHEQTGLLSKERDHSELAGNLRRILSDREYGRRLGRQGREYVCENFNIKKQTAELEIVYQSLIERDV